MATFDSLAGKILIAMPAMSDPRFARSVVLICEHGPTGAMGLVLNQPMRGVSFPELLEQLGIEADTPRTVPVHTGGPVEPVRGFVLHRAAPEARAREGRIILGHGLAMTGTRDILEDLAQGRGPDEAVLALGYAGWAPGQLEAEMLDNGWLAGKVSDSLVFGRDDEAKWSAALMAQGINPSQLSGAAGHA